MKASHLVLLAAGLLTAACGGSDGTVAAVVTPELDESATVHATASLQFTPGTVTLAVGGTVDFDFQSVQHNVYFDNAPTGAPANITAPTSNTTVSRTFSTPGRFVYNCHLHPGMSGVIVVQ